MDLICLYDDAALAIHSGDIILIGIPSAFIRDTLHDLPETIFQGKKILSSIKGILPDQNVILNEYLEAKFQVLLHDYCRSLSCRRNCRRKIIVSDLCL
jgi:glycerol-3-phosphate dehydrogenase (NAD(P)+)